MSIYDGSRYRPIVDINAAMAAGLDTVLYKATQGAAYVDPTYAAARQLCLDNGLRFAAYHFIESGNINAQVDHFLSVANLTDGMRAAVDWELYASAADCEAFVARLYALTGRYPFLYSRKSWAEPLIGNRPTILSRCPGWFASYQQNPNWPNQWYTYVLHQYTNGTDGPLPHGIPGIRPDIDMNWFNPRFGDIAQWWINGAALPSDPPVADKFVAPIGPEGLQSDGLWLRQPTNAAGQWYDANYYKNLYTLPSGSQAYHTGGDLNIANDGDRGQPIRAVCNGVILFADRITGSSWGNLIIQESLLKDGSRVWFRYGHEAPLMVKAGDTVSMGQQIADVSNAFGAFPYHLHWDVSLSGVLSRGLDGAADWPGLRLSYLEANYVDPYVWLKNHMEVPVATVPVKWVAPQTRVPIFEVTNLKSKVIDYVAAGASSQIDNTPIVGDQNQIFYHAGAGFVAGDCVSFTSTTVTAIGYVQVDGLRRRVGPSVADAIVDTFRVNDKVEYVDGPGIGINHFVQIIKINDVAKAGYVSKDYLSPKL